MATPPADLVLAHLGAIRADLAEMRQGIAEAGQRLGHLEAQYATISGRFDRMAEDVGRIRDRLGLIDA